MNYINVSVLLNYISEDELIRLTDDLNNGTIITSKVEEAIKSAESEFESYLKGIYSEPLSNPLPKILVQIIVDITIYNLYKRRMRLDMPESITQIYKTAVDKLEKIRRGVITIAIDKKDSKGFIKVSKSEDDRIFGKTILDKL